MQEKILENKKHGMRVLLCCILLELVGLGLTIFGGIMLESEIYALVPLFVLGIVLVAVSWIPLVGLKVLKPQEALVLTLFGKYIGTLKGEGFYFINPFCVSVNPAAKTKLNQSGDVKTLSIATPPLEQSFVLKILYLLLFSLYRIYKTTYRSLEQINTNIIKAPYYGKKQ